MFIILTTAILNMMTAQGLTLYALVVCFGRLPRGDRQIFQNKIGEWALLTRYNQCAGKNDFYSHQPLYNPNLAPTPFKFHILFFVYVSGCFKVRDRCRVHAPGELGRFYSPSRCIVVQWWR